jgi:hypothetical protein
MEVKDLTGQHGGEILHCLRVMENYAGKTSVPDTLRQAHTDKAVIVNI